jgi:hypothetical protein
MHDLYTAVIDQVIFMDDHLKNKYSSAAVVLVDLFSSPTGRIKRVDSGKEYRSAPNLKETDGPGGSLEGARQKAGKILWETHMHMDLSTLIFQIIKVNITRKYARLTTSTNYLVNVQHSAHRHARLPRT